MSVTKKKVTRANDTLTAKERREVDYMFRRIDENLKKIARERKEIDKLRESTRRLMAQLRAA
jgi:hypothetical protein